MADIPESSLRAVFLKADIERNDKLNFEDAMAHFQEHKTLAIVTNSNTFHEFLVKADSDKDGSVTFEELKKAVIEAGHTITPD